MDIKNIVVKEYLESLTEKNELNRIFPILLESMGFTVLSKPTEYLGLPEYGKDIVAVGIDEDGIKKRFYFELKGGADKDITDSNFYGKDGIHDSIIQASYNDFISAFPEFEKLPLKIVIVHNGIIKGNVQRTLENLFLKTQENLKNISFDRWDISRLTLLFSEKLFGEYLLVDSQSTKLFNRVLVNLNTTDGITSDFVDLLEVILLKEEWKKSKKLSRRWQLLFETFKLIGFIIYTESKEYNNLEIAKRYLTHLVIKFWHWILKNNLENDKAVTKYFDQVFNFYYKVLLEYFKRTIPIANLKDGLSSEHSGRYEQIGYTKRTFEYLEYFCFILNVERFYNKKVNDKAMHLQLVNIINQNNVSCRPLIDIHSSVIISILNLFIDFGELQNAKNYLKLVLRQIKYAKENLDFIPDANNSIENVIRFTVTGVKPVYFSDSTSPILTVLMEYLALLDMEEEYDVMKEFILVNKIDLGLFVPYHGINSSSNHLISDKENDLEEQLFSKSFRDGYQSETRLTKNFDKDLNFEEFKIKIVNKKTEFEYNYRTNQAGYPFLKDLAHNYFQTPFFPDKWRDLII
ncbi:hypothetical protein [Flavobacterium yafengii]|uniref:hypothetical protein n=1 Tax=Flavobacterium yafengii TaxID=3041253 RepID=UPI0024A8CA73|nr:hypothetical protein [Flavobacterium yafengii]MDI5888465.1 hypothetical protein [Flavobacterium yafengii]